MSEIKIINIAPSGFYNQSRGKEKPSWPGKITARIRKDEMTFFGLQDPVFFIEKPVVLESFEAIAGVEIPPQNFGARAKMLLAWANNPWPITAHPALAETEKKLHDAGFLEEMNHEARTKANRERAADKTRRTVFLMLGTGILAMTLFILLIGGRSLWDKYGSNSDPASQNIYQTQEIYQG